MNEPKSELHRLIDKLPDNETKTVEKFLKFLIAEYNQRILDIFENVPEDEETLSEMELKAIKEAEQAIVENRVKPWEQVKSEFM